MSTRDTGAARVRSRRSIAHVPRSRMTSGLDKENATTDIGAVPPFEPNTKPTMKDKKSRSKSLGPGGLDALQNSNGNRRKVGSFFFVVLQAFFPQTRARRSMVTLTQSSHSPRPLFLSNQFLNLPSPYRQCETSHRSRKLVVALQLVMRKARSRAGNLAVRIRRAF